MLFNSLVFFIFAFVFFIFWFWSKKSKSISWVCLIVFSFFFYGWWDWRFLFLIVFSGLIDYCAALIMHRQKRYRRFWLILSLLGNIGSLAVFKYSVFLWKNLLYFFPSLPESPPVADFFLILPVGISFYTFQSMSYTIDVYRGELDPTKNILKFFAYLSMFPQLVAGPIVRASDLLPQLDHPKRLDEQTRFRGLQLILHGYFKKVVVADNLAPIVTAAFSAQTPSDSSVMWWGVMVAFSFQIYCDFSGYSDIARGLAKWMGFNFVVNFDHPYISFSLKEFWTRWHISLSSWFRDYIYIPLGGNRKGKAWEFVNQWVTMLVSGLWHGASWNFVIWGGTHAFFLSMEKILKYPKFFSANVVGRFVLWCFVMLQVIVAWVFFRATSLGQAIDILKIMFSFHGEMTTTLNKSGIILITIMILREFYILKLTKMDFIWLKHPGITTAALSVLVWASIFLRGRGAEFIYFQF